MADLSGADRDRILDAIAGAVSEAIVIVQRDFTVVYASPGAEDVIGFPPETLLHSPASVVHPDDYDRYVERGTELWAGEQGTTATEVYRVKVGDGAWRWLELRTSNHFDDPLIAGLITGYRDLTERMELQSRLAHAASHDSLTGLPNRALLLDRLTVALARAARRNRPVALVFCDLDGFKAVNDFLGHDAGDELLTNVASRMRAAVRPSDTVARMGGDEFVVLCEELESEQDAVVIADRVATAAAGPFDIRGARVSASVSTGIAFSGPGHNQPEVLLRAADAAMYRTKTGRAGSR